MNERENAGWVRQARSDMMRVAVYGRSHLAQTHRRAIVMRGFELVGDPGVDDGSVVCDDDCETAHLVFVAHDVLDHRNLEDAKLFFDAAVELSAVDGADRVPVILMSQVPPGTTRLWAGTRASWVFHQVDTIVMSRALQRAYAPEQIIVGCADPGAPLPLVYQEYLLAFGCPVLQVSFESAEVAKMGINFVLSKQIEAANTLARVAKSVGADYADVERALRNDARIGPLAYVHPGVINQHLSRDVETIRHLVARGKPHRPASTHAARESAGGHARAAKLSPGRRSEIARAAARARWATT